MFGTINGAYKFLSMFAQNLLQTVFSAAQLGFKGGLGFVVSGATVTGTMVAGVYSGMFTGKSSMGNFSIHFGVPAPEAATGIYFLLAAIAAILFYHLHSKSQRV